MTINDQVVYESQGTAVLTVSLSYATNRPVNIRYSTQDGTAKSIGRPNTRDFGAVNAGRLNFAAGTTTLTVPVQIFTDNITEPDEYFDVTLSTAVNATITDNIGRVTIKNGSPVLPVALAGSLPVEMDNIAPFSVIAYPNPSNNYFELLLKGNEKDPAMLTITDMLGRQVKIVRVQNNVKVRFGEDWSRGVYYGEVLQGRNRQTFKMIKQ